MENLKLKAEKREKVGGLNSKTAVYKENKIPGIIYGGKDEPLPILVNNNELLKIINNEGLFNTVVEVELDKKTENVVFKEVQKHPSKNIFTHIDLQRVVEGTKVNVVVPVLLKNQDKCFGVKIEGGVINHVLKEISVLASPESIPESIEVDMEEIKTKEKVRLSSLTENNDYDFPSSLKNQDPVLVSVLTARGGGLDFEDEEVDDVEEGAEADSTEASDEKSSEETSLPIKFVNLSLSNACNG